MSRKLSVLSALAAALATSLVVLVSAGAHPSTPQGGRVLQIVEHSQGSHFIDNAPRGPFGLGDQILVTKFWFDTHGARVGTLHSVCSEVSAGRNPYLYCSGIAQLKNGTLTLASGSHLNDDLHLASITGGTGAYVAARGWIESKTAPGGHDNINDDIVHLLP